LELLGGPRLKGKSAVGGKGKIRICLSRKVPLVKGYEKEQTGLKKGIAARDGE